MKFPNIEVQPHWLKTLEAAAEILPDCRWLCHAVSIGTEPEHGQEIRKAIACAIAPFSIVNSWLICETGTDFATSKEAKEYRKAWLNHMIEQCRSMQKTD